MLIILLGFMSNACGGSSGNARESASYFDRCDSRALYCASVIGYYVDEYEIVVGQWVLDPKLRHAECRAKIKSEWYWITMCPLGVRLTTKTDINLREAVRIYTLAEFAEAIERWQLN